MSKRQAALAVSITLIACGAFVWLFLEQQTMQKQLDAMPSTPPTLKAYMVQANATKTFNLVAGSSAISFDTVKNSFPAGVLAVKPLSYSTGMFFAGGIAGAASGAVLFSNVSGQDLLLQADLTLRYTAAGGDAGYRGIQLFAINSDNTFNKLLDGSSTYTGSGTPIMGSDVAGSIILPASTSLVACYTQSIPNLTVAPDSVDPWALTLVHYTI